MMRAMEAVRKEHMVQEMEELAQVREQHRLESVMHTEGGRDQERWGRRTKGRKAAHL